MQNQTLRVNCYVRITATGKVGRLGNIYRDERGRRTFGVDWAGEYTWTELTRISPAQYHATDSSLKLAQNNRG